MKLSFLVIVVILAVLVPLFWITGTLTAIFGFWRHRREDFREWLTPANGPELGLTMADGGNPVDEKRGTAAATGPATTGTAPTSAERIPPGPVTGKMFWWGGYY